MSTPPSPPEPGTFQAWPKIARLNRDIVITEKIDGTNAAVCIAESGEVWAQSRKRVITPEADNAGFAAWVAEHADALRALGPGRHYGEWWGRGVQRGYGLDHKRFSLFNTGRWADRDTFAAWPFLADSEGAPTLAPECCRVVPMMYRGLFGEYHVQSCLEVLREHGSMAAPGFQPPEGIVIFHTASGQLFKVTLEKDEAPKGLPAEVQA